MIDLQKLVDYLGSALDDLEESGITEDDIQENHGNSGEMHYSYFLVIPDDADFKALKKVSIPLKPGEPLNTPRWELEAETEQYI